MSTHTNAHTNTYSWSIDHAHSAVEFTVRHMVFSKVRGRFSRWDGKLEVDDAFANGNVEVALEVASIDTGNADRDAHLRSADFFDAEQYPVIRFEGRAVRKLSEEELELDGELTLRGVTRPITLQVEHTGSGTDPWGQHREGFQASASLQRKDFGLTWNQALETGGVLVGDKVEIGIELQLIRAAAAQAD